MAINGTDDKPTIRIFVCIDLPAEIKTRLEHLQENLRRFDAQVSWVKSSNVHLTLRFLGEVDRGRVAAITSACETAASGVGAFEVTVGGTGCFPTPGSPRVLWVGLTEVPDELSKLQRALESELERKGFQKEKKKFSPHLTIGRLRTPKNARALAEKLIETGFEQSSFVARELIVMRSRLSPSGSIYIPQAVVPIGVRGSTDAEQTPQPR